ncbi:MULTISPECIES: DUF1942 domain-containing protein [Mycolicibacterium]|nr:MULTISPECIES: DUF1942 domain-containing protein [Mycolicibacterium]MCV7432637.1 MPT63 family protein [Mycolicibacterium bacteremicum]QVI30293.1 MPT63 family protein [Mycolicibacterium neoaurum]
MMTVAVAAGLLGATAPIATAAEMKCPHHLGSAQQMSDAGGAVVQEWAITDLQPSVDNAPGYPLAGRLWEASATVRAVSGTVTPVIPNFRATGKGQQSYPVLWQLASPAGISAATLQQGQSSSGKLYFDITGTDPSAVLYGNPADTALMMWCDMEAMAPMMSMQMPMADCPCCDGDCMCCTDPS